MDRDVLVELVVRTVRERLPSEAVQILPDTRLGAEGLGLDSIDVLELVLELERRCGIVLRDESLTAADLETPATLGAYIASVSGG